METSSYFGLRMMGSVFAVALLLLAVVSVWGGGSDTTAGYARNTAETTEKKQVYRESTGTAPQIILANDFAINKGETLNDSVLRQHLNATGNVASETKYTVVGLTRNADGSYDTSRVGKYTVTGRFYSSGGLKTTATIQLLIK